MMMMGDSFSERTPGAKHITMHAFGLRNKVGHFFQFQASTNLLAGGSRDLSGQSHMTNFAHYLEFILDSNSNLHASISQNQCDYYKILLHLSKHTSLTYSLYQRNKLHFSPHLNKYRVRPT